MMTRKLVLLALCAASLCTQAKTPAKNVLDIKHSITDSSIIYPESFETDTQKLLESWYMKNYTASDTRYKSESDPNVSDETITRRLAELPTAIEMPFNQIVRSYIDRYTKRGRAQVAAILGLSLYYMPIFEQALEAKGLPLELKYLPVIESGLDPNAVSRHGAAGLWQFMPGAARGLGMELNSLVDERRDPYVASERAAQFLKDLYDTYGDWSLAIAAYNCGPGTVNKALRRAGGDPASHDFWSIYSYLPAETRGYVPMFIAANYVMNHYRDHNISPVLPTKPLVTDTIGISQRIHFNQISAVLDIPVEELRLLNPQFRADVIPATADHHYALILPSQQIHAYIMSENDILAHDADRYRRRTTAEPGVSMAQETLVAAAEASDEETALSPDDEETAREVAEVRQAAAAKAADASRRRTVTHKVAEGETLSSIAQKYGTTAAEIKSANALRRNAVRPGQELRVQTSLPEESIAAAAPAQTQTAPKAAAPAKTTPAKKTTAAASKKKTTPAKPKTHTIKSGENLTTIANRYGVSVAELRKANNLSGDAIRAGKTLNIPAKKATSSKKRTSKKKRRR